KGANYVKGFLKNKQSDLQSTFGLDNLSTLPPYADITTNDFGVNAHLEQLDYRLNPRKGYQVDMTGAIGVRNIRKNSAINPELYDSLQLKSTQYAADIVLRMYRPIYGRHVLALMNRSALIHNPQIFENEMYRIGGLKSLRGFDEESIFATAYSITNVEYRYITDLNSFLFAFINGAWYTKSGISGTAGGRPIGFGAGMNFETRIGIMSISYALGKGDGQSIQIRSGKVHFGIVNYF
ncbi:MAG: BamA/TamA family outer membrane protein, partial [Bacteroidota bacterium]